MRVTADNANRRVNPENSLEAGWGRVEISPESTHEIDYLLNVMYVCDADCRQPVEKAEILETDAFAGAKIFDRVVLFPKEKTRTRETVAFHLPGSEKRLKSNVAGIASGVWSIRADGTELGTATVLAEGGMLFVTGPAGAYELTYRGEG